MRRTYLDLPEDQWKQLNSLSRQQAVSTAELIRRAIAQIYPVKRRTQFEQAVDAITGMWRDRLDLDSESYVRALRQDDRLERLLR